jgi:hypothetical protein
MWKATVILVVLSVCCSTGCESRPSTLSTDADADFGGWSWDALKPANAESGDVAVSATWGSWKKKFVYVILADPTATATTKISTSGAQTRYEVDLTLPNRRTAEVRIETADGKTGGAVLAGQSYDLARGSVFVVSLKGETVELIQLKHDISDEAAGLPGVVKLVRNDPDLVRMFAKLK